MKSEFFIDSNKWVVPITFVCKVITGVLKLTSGKLCAAKWNTLSGFDIPMALSTDKPSSKSQSINSNLSSDEFKISLNYNFELIYYIKQFAYVDEYYNISYEVIS